jgi:hypothetical protein
MSFAGLLLGEAAASGTAPFADADGDGVSDTLEATAALQALGFSAGVNNVSPTNLFESIYTEDSILDLVTGNQTMIEANGANVTLTLPVFKSGTLLDPWIPAGNLELTVPKEGSKQFYRIQVTGAE